MIVVLFILVIFLLKKKLSLLDDRVRNNIMIIIFGGIFIIILFNLYVEYYVGWKYGVPFDDDSRWIFKASEAINKGEKWDRLYRLVSRDWDITNRSLSISNFGQYLYATIISYCLYHPVLFDLHINIYLVYLTQLMLISVSVIDVIIEIDGLYKKSYKKLPSLTVVFFMLLFYPMVIFNAGKMIREAIYIFAMLEVFACFINYIALGKLNKFFIIYSFLFVLIRPMSIIIVVPLSLWTIFGDIIAISSNIVIMAIFIVGTVIINKVMSIIGWSYSLGEVSISELIHLFMFPNILNQFSDFLMMFSHPSWQTIVYFFQSFWNIPFIFLMVIGILNPKDKKLSFLLFTIFINSMSVYSISYSIGNFTPRYKLTYFIPQVYFVYIGLCTIKNKIRIRKAY